MIVEFLLAVWLVLFNNNENYHDISKDILFPYFLKTMNWLEIINSVSLPYKNVSCACVIIFMPCLLLLSQFSSPKLILSFYCDSSTTGWDSWSQTHQQMTLQFCTSHIFSNVFGQKGKYCPRSLGSRLVYFKFFVYF